MFTIYAIWLDEKRHSEFLGPWTHRHLLYVGQTQNLDRRIKAHRARSPWMRPGVEVEAVATCSDRYRALLIEGYLIEKWLPEHNKAGKPTREVAA